MCILFDRIEQHEKSNESDSIIYYRSIDEDKAFVEMLVNSNFIDRMQANVYYKYFNKLLEDPNVKNDFIEIVNFEEVTEFKFSYKEALQLPDLFAGLNNKKKYRGIIMIGEKDFPFGMARMLSNIAENNLTIRVVRSEEDAEKEVNLMRR